MRYNRTKLGRRPAEAPPQLHVAHVAPEELVAAISALAAPPAHALVALLAIRAEEGLLVQVPQTAIEECRVPGRHGY
jgi:hypothetical protein